MGAMMWVMGHTLASTATRATTIIMAATAVETRMVLRCVIGVWWWNYALSRHVP